MGNGNEVRMRFQIIKGNKKYISLKNVFEKK